MVRWAWAANHRTRQQRQAHKEKIMTNEIAPAMEFAPGIKMHHATRAKAAKLAAMFLAEYPKLTLECTTEEDGDDERCTGFVVEHSEGDEPIYEGEKVPNIADVLDACADAGLNPEADEEEADEPKISGSVVPESYRQIYALASTNGQTCGDWLAEILVLWTHSSKGFMADYFTEVLNANGVDMTKPWAKLPTSGQKGWIGRYRMNGRQVLEKSVALTGELYDHAGHGHDAPEDFLTTMRAKHGKWLAKIAKAEAAALASAGKTEGEAA
jgi:hypothetical protein